MRLILVIVGFLVLILTEVLRVYFIMPFPGSQQAETIDLAYFLHNNIGLFRLAGGVLIVYPLFSFFKSGTKISKVLLAVLLVGYIVIFYLFNFKFLADKMFLMPTTTAFANSEENKIPVNQLIIGITV